MARKPVDIRQNASYHVWSRCIEWRPLMRESCFRDLFLEVIALTQEKYRFELNQYQIMDTHFHLIITTVPGGGSISRIMQFLKSRFAQRYYKITRRIGPFWNERYRYTIIDDSRNPVRYLLWLLWYLAYNPVRKKIVSEPRMYPYCGINSYLDDDFFTPVKITLHKFFIDLGKSAKERIEILLEYESAYRRRLSWLLEWAM